MKKKRSVFKSLWPIGGIVLILAVFVLYSRPVQQTVEPVTPQLTNYTRATISIGDKVAIPVEIADTSEKTTLGLSYRESLPENQGMLFIFPVSHIPTFWMKGMNFPLDMIWIDEKNVIVDITENVPHPAPGTPEYKLPHYSPKSLAKLVLEVNAGFAKKNGIEIGDTVKLEN